MLKIEGKNIQITRGDMLSLTISATNDIKKKVNITTEL